ncbi:hypothetical protein SDC9_175609 [bioreactor metagenome]|uniref:Uncharacterized protein n=1 Tax=bioreactor metagenome TaxID=1076179 RepID=A0A645GPN0_9ZZZZ
MPTAPLPDNAALGYGVAGFVGHGFMKTGIELGIDRVEAANIQFIQRFLVLCVYQLKSLNDRVDILGFARSFDRQRKMVEQLQERKNGVFHRVYARGLQILGNVLAIILVIGH